MNTNCKSLSATQTSKQNHPMCFFYVAIVRYVHLSEKNIHIQSSGWWFGVEDEVEDETEYVEVNLMVASSSPMRQRTAHLLHLQSWWIHSSMPCRPFKQWGRLRQGLKFIRALLWMWQTQTPFCPVGVSFACGFTCGFTGTEKNASDALERRTESTVAGLERLAITW